MKLDGAALFIVVLLFSAKFYKLSMALSLLFQSFVFVASTSDLNSSIRPRSTGLDTEAVRFLKVFWDSPKPADDPWLLDGPLGILRCYSFWVPIPDVPIGPLLPPRGAWV